MASLHSDLQDMATESGSGPAGTWLRDIAWPLVAWIVVVGVVSGLVLGGVVQGHTARELPGDVRSTTTSTVLIAP